MHVDLMDVLSGYGASMRVGLGMMSELLGFPGKSFIESEVYEHILRGQEDIVREYCKMDVLLTLLVFLSWLRSRGDVDTEDVRELVAGIRRRLGGETFDGWGDIVDGLEGWPAPLDSPRGWAR
jgi:hypothetical protein